MLMNFFKILILNPYESYIIMLRDKIKHNKVKSINSSLSSEFIFKYLRHNHDDKNVF